MAKRKRSSRFSIVPKKTTETTLLGEITEEDKLLAREVWMQVESNYIVISKALFSELFRVHPEYKDFFKDLIDIDSEEDDAWLNPRFERHMIHVLLPALGAVIRNVDRPEAIRDQMIKLGKVHKVKVVGLKKKHIETLKKLLLVTVKRCIGRGMRAEHELALFKIFSSSISIFEEALEEKVHENGTNKLTNGR